jgi:hypothetical protein
MWNLVLVHLKTVLVSVQYKCTICAKHTVGTEIVLDTPDGTPTRLKWKLDSVRLEIVLNLMQDNCTVCTERTTGSEIVSDAPDGTPR